MQRRKKTWNRKRNIIRNVGLCKYCNQMIVSDESFVMFMGGIPAHYACMKKDDEQQQVEKKLWANLQTKMVEKKPSVFSW